MPGSSIVDYPRTRLMHKTDTRRSGNMIVKRFQLAEIAIPRPPSGSTLGVVECPVCHKDFAYKVMSATSTKVRWVMWLTLAVLLVAMLLFAVYTIATWGTVDDAGGVTNGPPVGLISAGIFGGFFGGLICL